MYLLFIKLFFEYIPKLIFIELAAKPGIARGKKILKRNVEKIKFPFFFSLLHECPKKFQPIQSNRLA